MSDTQIYSLLPGVRALLTPTPGGALIRIETAGGVVLSAKEAGDMAGDAVAEWRGGARSGHLTYLPTTGSISRNPGFSFGWKP